MRDTMAVRYFMAMTGNDIGRVFSAGSVAGRLIAAWRLRLKPTAVLSAIPDHIIAGGLGIPLVSENPTPVSVLMEPNPLAEMCGLQAAVFVTTGQFVVKGLAPPADVEEALRLAEGIVSEFGVGDLKLLVRTLLMAPYDSEGLWGVPDMRVIVAADSTPHALASDMPETDTSPLYAAFSPDSRPRKE
ncbi:hypothetical protein [Rhizobium sp. BK251]|uniref:hypothetical protein n=1 Tax=Rhizobium sp. BK251 TaxID=2512125 RepID=UPI00104FB6E8|nr:hypothetical protein [Rhizobium sp. BK251]TCL74447.1 hypothetical protein EV286_1027 [Rhizobium sp. BK251]